mmetsp:Transcript_26176/g.78260  ORF Transcript_26176/g.78260 Transcript_26176/m.78260 type:complete len:258 (+) Transcript_26176:193-966(+)
MQASRCCILGVRSERRQLTRKCAPMFLFGLPQNSLALECTRKAMLLTKTVMCSFRTSVVCVKFCIAQQQKMPWTGFPGCMALSVVFGPPFMLCTMISDPASPKPRASNEPILIIVCSRMTVSMASWTSLFEEHVKTLKDVLMQLHSLASLPCSFGWCPSWPPLQVDGCIHGERASVTRMALRFRLLSAPWSLSSGALAALCSPSLCSTSFICTVDKGLVLILLTLAIIRSMGVSTNWLASFEKVMAPTRSITQMNNV